MSSTDKTKDVLEQILAQLYSEQARDTKVQNGSYLLAQDGQFLGAITENSYDTNSILNSYGPYGSKYSGTSIFNEYSPYGSQYGAYSINNPYCTQAPQLVIDGVIIGFVTANQNTLKRISPEAFLCTLKNDLKSLLKGNIIESESHARQLQGESYIEAQDGIFIGKITPNKFDQESIFNKFGAYGNKYSQVSIFNKFSPYGSQFSNVSPYNKFTKTPPKIYVKGKFFAYLSVNTMLRPRIDPEDILSWAEKNISRFG